jgi:hypothetical protein
MDQWNNGNCDASLNHIVAGTGFVGEVMVVRAAAMIAPVFLRAERPSSPSSRRDS